MSHAAYNEIDPKAAAWLRELIKQGLIAPGDVIEASIEDLTPNDLKPYTQVHFFAGIGVWSYALRGAGWPDDRPVWTGSCPCQPFSAAGKGGGFADERHLWPAFHYLIDQCRPDVVFGEQVASKDGLGWLDLVQADLEGTSYASGAVDLCAAGVGAPHIRQRLWWFGERLEDAARERPQGLDQHRYHEAGSRRLVLAGGSEPSGLDHDDDARLEGRRGRHKAESGRIVAAGPAAATGEPDGLVDTDNSRAGAQPGNHSEAGRETAGRTRSDDGAIVSLRAGATGGLVDANGGNTSAERQQRGGEQRQQPEDGGAGLRNYRPSPTNGLWADADWLHCRDGKWRPVEPGTFPLAHGAAERVGRLRGYGNAIVAPCAQAFIEAYLETQAPDDRGFRLTEVSHLSLEGVFA